MNNLKLSRPLGELEQAVLIAVVHLEGNAYGVTVQEEVKERTGRNFSTGAIYSVLTRLELKGMLDSRIGDPSPERGGRRKRLYQASEKGRVALDEAKQFTWNLWKDFLTA